MTLAKTDDSINPIIKNFYLPSFKLIKDKSETAYQELKAFITHDRIHDTREKLAVLIYLLNFIAVRIRQKGTMYHQEYFDLAQIGIEQSLFITAGSFPTMTFISINNTACHLGKDKWAQQFIEQWSKYLKLDDRILATKLALARINFERRHFEKTINALEKTKSYKNVHIAIHNRILLAAAYCEQKSPPSVQIHHCDNSMLWVRRQKNMNAALKENVLNFFEVLRLLIHHKSEDHLLKALETKSNIAFREWLTKKINELNRPV